MTDKLSPSGMAASLAAIPFFWFFTKFRGRSTLSKEPARRASRGRALAVDRRLPPAATGSRRFAAPELEYGMEKLSPEMGRETGDEPFFLEGSIYARTPRA